MDNYDADAEIRLHIADVQAAMTDITGNLFARAVEHDASKLLPPEIDGYRLLKPEMVGVTFGTPEYERIRERYQWIIDLHVSRNDHHTAYYAIEGIRGMSLLAMLEMLADWRASAQPGPIRLTYCIEEFKIPVDIAKLISKTLVELGWSFE